ncbi:MAG: hypothetical protein H7255_20715 [Ramlibacter sp.]|nr:hypothetical protein [Ramlibacter sp.]
MLQLLLCDDRQLPELLHLRLGVLEALRDLLICPLQLALGGLLFCCRFAHSVFGMPLQLVVFEEVLKLGGALFAVYLGFEDRLAFIIDADKRWIDAQKLGEVVRGELRFLSFPFDVAGRLVRGVRGACVGVLACAVIPAAIAVLHREKFLDAVDRV